MLILIFSALCSANVLLDLSFRAKVGDFGLARPLHDTSDTRTNRVVGTSGYIPPEYYRGTITTRMDSFAFGVVSMYIDWPARFVLPLPFSGPVCSACHYWTSVFCMSLLDQCVLHVITGPVCSACHTGPVCSACY